MKQPKKPKKAVLVKQSLIKPEDFLVLFVDEENSGSNRKKEVIMSYENITLGQFLLTAAVGATIMQLYAVVALCTELLQTKKDEKKHK